MNYGEPEPAADYQAPKSLREALDVLDGGGHRIVAGGTDVFPSLSDRPPPRRLLDVTGLPELRGIVRTAEGWRFGGGATWTDVIRTPLPPAFDGLKAAAREVGSVQIQNAGTIAGNLCNASPAADGVPPLLALDAVVELESVRSRRELPLSRFICGVRQTELRPDELVKAVRVPTVPREARSAFLKLGSRKYLVISIAMVAVTVWTDSEDRVAGVRIAVGACSPVAVRLHALEQALMGRRIRESDALFAPESGGFDGLSPIDDFRGSAVYRRQAAAEITRRALLEATSAGTSAHG
ncbi:MAG: xanthine dehydrogenase family protein subunit M [Paracoccaceae bacterium]|nr:xanthine dehydrogenase family protein subunit M [Paracoccaceae bacterium]MDE2914272.1 xanthine dehydrogenase family protein subunit M [Paracoccaceae bacterium]